MQRVNRANTSQSMSPFPTAWSCLSAVHWLTALTVVGAFLGASSLPAQSAAPTEYEVKAAFLYNFAKFVEWPDDVSAGSRDTITIAVLGQDPFGNVLDQTVADKTVRGRKILVRRSNTIDEVLDCQVVFISASEEHRLGGLPEALGGKSILTIGETERFVQSGGIISFRNEANKVRFDINLQAAERARLTLGSQLLKLAHIVKESSRPRG